MQGWMALWPLAANDFEEAIFRAHAELQGFSVSGKHVSQLDLHNDLNTALRMDQI